jgi:hypothetical protein
MSDGKGKWITAEDIWGDPESFIIEVKTESQIKTERQWRLGLFWATCFLGHAGGLLIGWMIWGG